MSADESLSALEEALRMALQTYSREQVIECILDALPATSDTADGGPEPGLHGRIEKVSVSLPAELTQAIRARTGRGGFSRYVAEAIQQHFQQDQLGDLLAELEEEYGPVSEDGVREAMAEWPDYEPE